MDELDDMEEGLLVQLGSLLADRFVGRPVGELVRNEIKAVVSQWMRNNLVLQAAFPVDGGLYKHRVRVLGDGDVFHARIIVEETAVIRGGEVDGGNYFTAKEWAEELAGLPFVVDAISYTTAALNFCLEDRFEEVDVLQVSWNLSENWLKIRNLQCLIRKQLGYGIVFKQMWIG